MRNTPATAPRQPHNAAHTQQALQSKAQGPTLACYGSGSLTVQSRYKGLKLGRCDGFGEQITLAKITPGGEE